MPPATALPTPVVADRCRIVIDRRFRIEENLTAVKREITDVLDRVKATRPSFTCSVRDLFEVHPVMTDQNAAIVRATAAAIGRVLATTARYVVSPGTYDQNHIDRIGRLHNCIAYGPGLLHLAHQPGEWIGVQDMQDRACVMALVLQGLLT